MAKASNKVVNHQTGPKTAEGKKVVSKNASKASIFTKGYLANEDVVLKQAQFEQLCEQWGADDPSRQLVLRTIEQASLGLERMMGAEKIKIEGMMQSQNIAQKFANIAGLDPIRAMEYPFWFFSEDDGGQKEYAVWIDQVWKQAKLLQTTYSDRDVPKIPERFPELYEYVMCSVPPNASFLMTLGQQYKQQTVTLNLAELMNQIRAKYEHHLIWAQAPRRHQLIVDGIRASQMCDVMDLEKSNRYATAFQNRILKGFQALAVLDQYETRGAIVIDQHLALEVSDDPPAESQCSTDAK